MMNQSQLNKFEKQVIAKARVENIKDFSETEIMRVFDNVVQPSFCKLVFRSLVKKGLTLTDITFINLK